MLDVKMADKKNLSVLITEDQRRAIRRAVNRDRSTKSISDLIRVWLADYVESQGEEWPEDDLSWGGKRGN